MTCEAVRTPTGSAFVCSRGAPPSCHTLGVQADYKFTPEGEQRLCPQCGHPVDTYETVDGRHLILRHQSRHA